MYQSRGSATVWNSGDTYWGHAAGNLSHWHCLPPALAPGSDFDGANTTYDRGGVFTGSVTIVGGVPIASYPGEPGDSFCLASPLNLSDPLLTLWKKSPLNPLGNDDTYNTTGGPLGCTGSWLEPTGNFSTTIQSRRLEPGQGLKTAFFTSSNFRNWSWLGDLGCAVCDKLTTPCCDFFPVTCADPSCANPPSGDRWAFGVNSFGGLRAGGLITGTLNRSTLAFTPDNSAWAAAVLAGDESAQLHYAYDYGAGQFPKTYVTDDGRRIAWRWISGAGSAVPPTWYGMQSVPTVISPAAADDATNAMLAYPVAELTALRALPPLANLTAQSVGGGDCLLLNVSTRHLDAVVTFRGLAALTAAELAQLSLVVVVFAPLVPAPGGWKGENVTWSGAALLPPTPPLPPGWLGGGVNGGPLALRSGQDALEFRILADGSVVEAFWDGGRARCAIRSFPPLGFEQLGLTVSASSGNVTADVVVYAMGSAWLEPVV